MRVVWDVATNSTKSSRKRAPILFHGLKGRYGTEIEYDAIAQLSNNSYISTTIFYVEVLETDNINKITKPAFIKNLKIRE